MEQHERSSESCRRALDGMGRMFGFRRHPFRERPSAVRGQRGAGFYFLLGRLKPGVSKPQAAADATVIANQLAKINAQDYPEHFHVLVKALGDTVIGRFESTLYTILAAVGLLLLIGCGNVANLMLARATSREKEFALRAVLGAGRARLVRLLLVESLVLAIGGAALGVLIAWGGLKLIVAAMPQNFIPAESVIELNAPVMAFTLAVAVLTALTFGLAPALRAARRDLNDPLRDSGKGVIGGLRTGRMRDTVVVAEVADAADRRGALDAELCSAARGAFWTAGGRRLTDTIAVA